MVPITEIAENEYDLNIGRYIRTTAEDVVDVETALKDLREAEEAFEEARSAMWERLKEAGYA
jgi:type I restriction enzyme M protein